LEPAGAEAEALGLLRARRAGLAGRRLAVLAEADADFLRAPAADDRQAHFFAGMAGVDEDGELLHVDQQLVVELVEDVVALDAGPLGRAAGLDLADDPSDAVGQVDALAERRGRP